MKPAGSQGEILLAAITSGYRPFPRLLLFALGYAFDNAAGGIPDGLQPSLTELAHMTGMHRATVKRCLNWLEAAEPVRVHRDRPDLAAARRFHLRTRYAVLVPDELGAASARAGRSTPRELGAVGAGLGAASAGAGRSLPRELGAARAASSDDEDSSTRAWELPEVVAAAVDELGAAGFTLTGAEAAEVARRVLAGREIRTSPEVYLRATLRRSARLYAPARSPQPPPPPPAPGGGGLDPGDIHAALRRGWDDVDSIRRPASGAPPQERTQDHD